MAKVGKKSTKKTIKKETELRKKAKNFIREYQKYGYYKNISNKEEDEAIDNIIQTVKNEGKWPKDWRLIGGERNIFWFDTEWMGDLDHMYGEFLSGLEKISKDELKFENVEEIVTDEDSEAWVEFDWMEQRHHIDVEFLFDHVDFPSILTYLNDLLKKKGSPYRLVMPYLVGDQTAVLSYLTLDQIKGLDEDKGWPVQDIYETSETEELKAPRVKHSKDETDIFDIALDLIANKEYNELFRWEEMEEINKLKNIPENHSKYILLINNLIKVFEITKDNTCEGAARQIAEIGDARAVELLINVLDNKSPTVRYCAALSLGIICDKKAVKPLIKALDDKDLVVRSYAAKALGQIADHSAVGPLISALRDNENYVREEAHNALVKIGEPAVEPLIPLLKDKDSYFGLGVAKALSDIKSENMSKLLSPLLKDDDIDIRLRVALALKSSDSKIAIKPLINLLKNDDQDVVLKAIKILGKLQHERAVDSLLELMESEDKKIHIEAIKALGENGSTKAIKPLIKQTGNKESEIRIEAERAIIKIIRENRKDQSFYRPLNTAIRHRNPNIRSSAAAIFGTISYIMVIDVGLMFGMVDDRRNRRTKEVTELLITALKDNNVQVKKNAIHSLGQIRNPESIDPLLKMMKDKDISVRMETAFALWNIDAPSAVEPLIEVMNYEGIGYDRGRAAGALGFIGDKKAVEPLIKLLKEENIDLLCNTIEALGKLGDSRAIEPLTELLDHENKYVKSAAKKAIRNIKSAQKS